MLKPNPTLSPANLTHGWQSCGTCEHFRGASYPSNCGVCEAPLPAKLPASVISMRMFRHDCVN